MNGQARASKKEGREFDNGHSNTKYIRWVLGAKVIDRFFRSALLRASSENLESRNANDFSLENIIETVGGGSDENKKTYDPTRIYFAVSVCSLIANDVNFLAIFFRTVIKCQPPTLYLFNLMHKGPKKTLLQCTYTDTHLSHRFMYLNIWPPLAQANVSFCKFAMLHDQI